MESWGLVWFYLLNRVQIPLYCVTTSDKPHPNLPSRIAPGCFPAGNPNPNPSLEGGRPPVHPANPCWAPALPGCDFSGMQGWLWSGNRCCLHFPIELGRPQSAMDSGLSRELCLCSGGAEVVSRWEWRFQLLLSSLPHLLTDSAVSCPEFHSSANSAHSASLRGAA